MYAEQLQAALEAAKEDIAYFLRSGDGIRSFSIIQQCIAEADAKATAALRKNNESEANTYGAYKRQLNKGEKALRNIANTFTADTCADIIGLHEALAAFPEVSGASRLNKDMDKSIAVINKVQSAALLIMLRDKLIGFWQDNGAVFKKNYDSVSLCVETDLKNKVNRVMIRPLDALLLNHQSEEFIKERYEGRFVFMIKETLEKMITSVTNLSAYDEANNMLDIAVAFQRNVQPVLDQLAQREEYKPRQLGAASRA